ncbi:MAG: Ig-like domain-containing protein [Bacteroidota bacterium]
MTIRLLRRRFRIYFIVISSSLLFIGALPFFAGSGLDNPEPIGAYLNGNFPSNLPQGVPYEPIFPNLTFDSPLTFNEVPGLNKIIVGQRDGRIFWFDKNPNVSVKNTMLDLSEKVGVVWDGGFLGLALHPQFGTPGKNYFYTWYTTEDANSNDFPNSYTTQSCNSEEYWGNFLILARYEANPTSLAVEESTEQILLKLRMYGTTHRGGGLLFGDDGFLYLTTGDQTAFKKSQDIVNNLDGGVLRLDVDQDPTKSHPPVRTMPGDHGFPDEITGNGYWIPNDNPFLSPLGDNFEEYYSLGHRNPHRMTKDRLTGVLYVGEIGGGRHEEINIIQKGKNYGWPLYEGLYFSTFCVQNLYNNMPHEQPLVAFPRAEANSIIGGFVYRGDEIPELRGKYVCADYGSGEEIFTVDVNTGLYEQLGNFTSTNIISFGEDELGELYILKQGNSTLFKMKSKNTGFGSTPELLSQTGAFTDLSTLTPSDGLIPYDLVESFWSDGALKKRWMAVPNNGSHNTAAEQITYSDIDDWDFPIGSVLVKHFELPIDERNPSITKRLETRFSIKASDGNFYFVTYKWNDQQTDAQLLTSGLDESIPITKQDGSQDSQTWTYPSTIDCNSCHNPTTGGTLGTRARYLNKDYTYGQTGRTANQLVTLSHLGILNQTITDSDTGFILTSKAMTDATASLEEKARSYLDLNCAYCHRPGTGNRGDFDLRLNLETIQTGLLSASPYLPLGIPNEKIVDPGNIGTSILYHRLNSTDPAIRMPPIAKNKIDTSAVQLIEDWINQLDSEPCLDRIIMETFNNVSGTSIAILKSHPNFPDSPDATSELNEFRIPINVANNYGVRVKGLLKAPETGTYYFWVAGDDNVELNLSTDSSETNKTRIAYHTVWTFDGEWNKYPTQKSIGIDLVAGQNYYIEALMNEQGGADNLSVGWRKPSNGNGSVPFQVIPCSTFDYFNGPPIIGVTGVSLDQNSVSLLEGETVTLTAEVQPSDATDASVIWDSSDEGIATVDSSGLVTAVAEGSATITVTTNDGGFQDTSEITITPLVSVTGIDVSPETATVLLGETQQLSADVLPSDATDGSVTWTSSYESIATVDANGLVSTVAQGLATITATTNDGDFQDTSEITVMTPVAVTGVNLIPETLTVILGGIQQLNAEVLPLDATDTSVTWTSSDENIAVVDSSGSVTAVALGSATITVTTNDGSFQDTSEVTIAPVPVMVTGVSLSPDTATILLGETQQLNADVLPVDASDGSVIWTSSDGGIATVDSNGLVTAVAQGSATITVTTNDGGFQKTSEVNVTPVPISVTGIDLVPDSAAVLLGDTQQLNADILPSNASDTSVTWISSDVGIATVDSSGLVTAVAEGLATITATTNDGGFQDTSEITVTIPVAVTGVDLLPETATILLGDTQQLTAEVLPSDATDTSVSWISSDENIASVDSSGLVTAVALGSATITVTTNDGGFLDTTEVTVAPVPISVTGVNLLPETAEVVIGETQQLDTEVLPSDATDSSVTWTSNDESIATVDPSGLVTAVAEGSAIITVTTNDGGFQDTSEITVTAPIAVTGVDLLPDTATILLGDTQQLNAEVLPSNATDTSVTWASSDESIATVDSSGLVTAVALGSATITVTTDDGGFQDASELNVAPVPISVTAISLSPETATMSTGGMQQLIAEVLPSDATDTLVTWASSDESIATVDSSGLVTAVALGSATITVTTNDGGFQDTSEITVSNNCIPSNVALGGTASQSSTYGNGEASLAIDGNTIGTSPWSADLQHTTSEPNPWWQIDLGAQYTIDELRIFNRTDSYRFRLRDFHVFVSDEPFPDGAGLGDLIGDTNLFSFFFSGEPALEETLALNTQGRYLRIQLSGDGILHMSEVEVLGCFLGNSPCEGVTMPEITDAGPYLDTNGVQTLSASPPGGSWSGASNDGTFDPSSMGAGTYSVTYTYDNGAGCVRSDTRDIVVNTLGTGGCVLSNVALIGTVSQSSTYGNGEASLAIDGNTVGTTVWAGADLQHTDNEDSPWWQIDLGAEYTIDELRIYNRTDNLQSRLNSFYIFISDTPFADGISPGDLAGDTGLYSFFFSGEAGLEEILTFNTQGRYVRIQLSGNGILHMAEVEILGCFLAASPCDGVALPEIEEAGPYLDTEGIQTLDASPLGGSWSGASDDGTFDPGMGAGTYSVTYTYDNGAGCVRSATRDITVNTQGTGGCILSNVATGGTASQSSTYGNGEAAIAIDGNTTGTSPWSADLQHTNNETRPWWQIDLGAEYTIDALRIFNRTDNLQSRLNNFYVFVSDTPFADGADLDDLTGDTGLYSLFFNGEAGLEEIMTLNTQGRYVRIQLSGNGILHIAEVEIQGCFLAASPCDGVALPEIADAGPYLDTDGIQTLDASPSGGSWSGASNDGTFDPGIGAGTYSVTYTYDNGAGCVRSDTRDITVNTQGTGGCILSNVAPGGTASQSSTYGDGEASIAIDGNTTGTSPWSADLQHTNNEASPWWQIDLGAEYTLDELKIHNRTDGFQSRLSNFYVFVSDAPFPDGVGLDDLTGDTGLYSLFFSGEAGLEEIMTLNAQGRYLRIQLSGNGILHMAEMEILGCPVEETVLSLKTVLPEITNSSLELSPVPATTTLYMDYSFANTVQRPVIMTLFDNMGRSIQNRTISPEHSNVEIDISQLPTGIYLLRLVKEDEILIKRFVIQK